MPTAALTQNGIRKPLNVAIEGIPVDIAQRLDMLKIARGCPKTHLIRDAIIEYVQRHTKPLDRALR
jgi:predicted transcriptional regulator